MQSRFYAVPASIRYVLYLGWRMALSALYTAHKQLILARECVAWDAPGVAVDGVVAFLCVAG
jgi:hypothetical protein